MKIKLNIKLTPKGREVVSDPSRFKIWKAGRRGSKTYTEAYFLAKNALLKRDKHWYVTKTLGLARDEFLPVLLDLLPRDLVSKVDDRLLNVRLTNGSMISCKSAEKADNMRGRGLGSAVLDEAAFIPPIWDTIIRPQLAGSRGPALIASSPKRGWFTKLFNKVKLEKLADWSWFHSTIYDNPHIERDEIETIRASTPANTWLQEYMAEEISETGVVYNEFDSLKNIFDPAQRFQEFKTFATLRGIDWGFSDPTGVVWLGISPEGYLIVSDEHEQNGWSANRHAEVIHSKSSGYKRIERNVLDKTAFRTEGTSQVSIGDQFRDEGIICHPSEGKVEASTDVVKRFMTGSNGVPWLYVSAKCHKLIAALQTWEHGDHEPDIAAAMRYAVTHAVSKHMTKLADTIPILKDGTNIPASADPDLVFAQKAMIRPASRGASWKMGADWDYVNGVPA